MNLYDIIQEQKENLNDYKNLFNYIDNKPAFDIDTIEELRKLVLDEKIQKNDILWQDINRLIIVIEDNMKDRYL